MQEMTAAKVWNTCGYVRLSKEDGDKEESNSVTGQKELIRDYLSRHPELRERDMKVDDGFTGSNFERPGFQEMIAQAKAGEINCIVVKDLSRFGRNYLEAGEYIEHHFPFLGVRFIAINDHFDSLHSHAESDEIMVPFKNLINEAYCRDTSIKIRSQLEIKRQRGDFIGSFAVFGYKKDPGDHHRLIADDFAADVVRDIFNWKLDGVSAIDIAARLTANGIPTPMDYKLSQGMRYTTAFRIKERSEWSAGMVLRILKNPVYTGVLEQGRVTTPSYKVKRFVQKPRDKWAIVENCHEPIIGKFEFETAQHVLAMDTRTAEAGQPVELFSGMVYCGECGGAMIRKTVPAAKKKYVYYVCAAHKKEKSCSAHSLRAEALADVVLQSLQQHIRDVLDLSELLELTAAAHLQQANTQKIQTRLAKKQEEIERCQTLLRSLYENLSDGIVDRGEYEEWRTHYQQRRAEAEAQMETLREEMERELQPQDWMEQFRRYGNITELDRRLLVSLVERVMVYRDRRVELVYRWQDEFQAQSELINQALSERRAV